MHVPRVMVLTALLGASAVLSGQARGDSWNRCKDRDPDLAIAGCTAIIESGRENGVNLAGAFNNRGNAYAHKGENDRAIQDYDQVLRLNPSYGDAFVNRGRARVHKGEFELAFQDHDQALRLDSNNANALANRGFAYGVKGDYDRAIQDLDQALRLNPNQPEAQAAPERARQAKGNAAAGSQAGAITYDLTSAEDANRGGLNPSGPWAFLGGTTLLHFTTIPQPSGSCFSGYAGLTTDWSLPGNCIPAFAVASGMGPGSLPDFLPGDVLVHSQDTASGATIGQASVTWTAPVTGTITVAGTIWYAQSAQKRSNNFALTLGGINKFTYGTVGYDTTYTSVGNNRANPLHFSAGGTLWVTAGEVLALEIQRSPGQAYGSIAGINLTVTETPGTQEPGNPVTLRVESHTENDGVVNMDGRPVCSLPADSYCTASIPPGRHDFEVVFHDRDNPAARPSSVKISGSFNPGEYRLMSVDVDEAIWGPYA